MSLAASLMETTISSLVLVTLNSTSSQANACCRAEKPRKASPARRVRDFPRNRKVRRRVCTNLWLGWAIIQDMTLAVEQADRHADEAMH